MVDEKKIRDENSKDYEEREEKSKSRNRLALKEFVGQLSKEKSLECRDLRTYPETGTIALNIWIGKEGKVETVATDPEKHSFHNANVVGCFVDEVMKMRFEEPSLRNCRAAIYIQIKK